MQSSANPHRISAGEASVPALYPLRSKIVEGLKQLRKYNVDITRRMHPGYSDLFLKGRPNELCRMKQERILPEYRRHVQEAER
jgi:hypothetical protein